MSHPKQIYNQKQLKSRNRETQLTLSNHQIVYPKNDSIDCLSHLFKSHTNDQMEIILKKRTSKKPHSNAPSNIKPETKTKQKNPFSIGMLALSVQSRVSRQQHWQYEKNLHIIWLCKTRTGDARRCVENTQFFFLISCVTYVWCLCLYIFLLQKRKKK